MFVIGETNIIILFLIRIIIANASLGGIIVFADIVNASTIAILLRLIELRTHFAPNTTAFTNVMHTGY